MNKSKSSEGKKVVEPSIYKTRVWKEIEKQSKKMPKFNISPVDKTNKDDVKKAKLMEKILNYEFKHNTNGFQTKYFLLQKELDKLRIRNQLRTEIKKEIYDNEIKERQMFYSSWMTEIE